MKRSGNVIEFFKTTGIGGIVFLLPLVVIGVLAGHALQVIWSVADVIGDFIPVKTPRGVAALIVAAIALLMLLCFFAGLVAQGPIGRRVHNLFEKYLLLFVPRYSVIKDQLAGNLSGAGKHRMLPITARFNQATRVGFELERLTDGRVVVYLPGAPDPWIGQVVCLSSDSVQPLDAEFGKVVSTFEKLGRGTAALLDGPSAVRPDKEP